MSKHIHIQGDEKHQAPEDSPNGTNNPSDTNHTDDPVDIYPDHQSPDAIPLVEDDAKRLEEAEQKAKESYDRLLRVSAEFDNYKKRSAREVQDVVKYANEKLAGELLNVVDNLERALDAATAQGSDDDPLLQGVSLVLDDILKILDRHHVKPITALGEPFDPSLHQAMMQEATEDSPPNTVVREMQKGYLMHDRLLRPTLVAVSVAGANPTKE